ncbi:dipeptidase [Chromatocurvus halotolerans]|uniref:Membrane dipeptidase n=1 Tax=Chromatocurvus halotolerans TaxID=1132028 RepID=A0A4R2L067_9GAMM|nr:dipeptidase [Chromatocurvus halotolerans]TCO77139.1 membrane dipeptidase [Chromatocurvus halotolerans]
MTNAIIPLLAAGAMIVTLSHAVAADTGQSRSGEDANRITQAKEILERVPLFDGHNDLPWQYRGRVNYRFSELDVRDTTKQPADSTDNPMHTDITRLREGKVGAQWWSVYTAANTSEPEAVLATMEQIDFVHGMIGRFPETFALALTADDVEEAFADGKIASLMGMEGGHSIANSLGALRMFHRLGARYMTLTHSRTLDWADAAGDDPQHDGLTAFGEEVVREMNRLGMVVDISHAAPATMRDAMAISEAPVMYSHSNTLALNGHPRNAPDDMLELLKENGGLIMVTFVESFTSEEVRQAGADRSAELARVTALNPGRPAIIEKAMADWDAANPMPKATLSQVADHIDHIRALIGVDHIGIGGDFDGVSTLPLGLEDVSTYPALFAELLKRGYTEQELEKIAGRNMLRVLRGVEKTAARLQNEREPSEMVFED